MRNTTLPLATPTLDRLGRAALGLAALGFGLVGCGGQSSSSIGGNAYDPSLNRGVPGLASANGKSPAPDAATWPKDAAGERLFILGASVPAFEQPAPPAQKKEGESVGDKATVYASAAEIGLSVVRLTAFPGGEGLKKSKDGAVTGVEPARLKALREQVELARSHKVQLYLTLVDHFDWAGKSPLADKKSAEAFAKAVVEPVTRDLKGREGVFAIALMAEPERQGEKAPKWDDVKLFLKTAADRLKRTDPERRVAVGPVSVALVREGKLAEIPQNFVELVATGELPTVQELRVSMPMVASLASPPKEEPAESTRAFLRSAMDKGYLGAMLGPAEGLLLDKDGKRLPAAEAISKVLSETKKS